MTDIKDVIKLLNPWWTEDSISEKLAMPYKRHFFNKIEEFKEYRQIVILSGLRRVGKTTLLYQMIQKLIQKKESKKIFYFSFDKEVKDLIELLEACKELTAIDYKKEKVSVFFDEITKFQNWASELKLIYDSHPNIKFYISSSSSINLEEDAIKNLAGRYFLINILPLSFKEFLELTNKKNFIENRALYEKEIKKEFYNYLLRSFPETINWDNPLIIKDYLKTTILDKIIKSDLPEKFKNMNKELIYKLIDLFYKEPGYYLDYDNLSKSLRISKNTLYKHIFYLKYCYLIRIVKNFRPNTLSTSRKLQRVYPYWWSLAYCYGDNNDKIFESLIFSSLDGDYYWRDLDKEIDFIKVIENSGNHDRNSPEFSKGQFLKNANAINRIVHNKKEILPIEIKNKENLNEKDFSTVKLFMQKFNLKKAIFIYLGKKGEKINETKKIELISFWDFLLNAEH